MTTCRLIFVRCVIAAAGCFLLPLASGFQSSFVAQTKCIPLTTTSSSSWKKQVSQLLQTKRRRQHIQQYSSSTRQLKTTALQAAPSSKQKLSSLPAGISPFEKSLAKSLDIQGSIRQLACRAIDRAVTDISNNNSKKLLLEIDFPCTLGGDLTKTQFDDLDNLQELDANRDWCVQFAPQLVAAAASLKRGDRKMWLVFPDDKECELAVKEWTGKRFRDAARFTSLRAACETVFGGGGRGGGGGETSGGYAKAWGSSIASTFNKLTGGDGILADSSKLDTLDVAVDSNRLHIVCQPGNGGPVEDWINVKALHEASVSANPTTITVVVNGALDKVRDGYYPPLFFPALGKTMPFYQTAEAAFVLRPLSDKGVYGWIFRVYPEPWQVVLQTAKPIQKGDTTSIKVEDTVALVSDQRPTYAQAVQALLTASRKQ